MTLATHIAVGAAAAKVFSTNPIQAFAVGFLSHYILDSVAHWDYKLWAVSSNKKKPSFTTGLEIKFNKWLLADIAKVILDALIGFVVVGAIFWAGGEELSDGLAGAASGTAGQNFLILFLGAVGGALPDFLQFLHGVWSVGPLHQLQRFHDFMHADRKLDDQPLIGVPIQIAMIIFAGWVLWIFG